MADPRNKPIARIFSIADPAVATGFSVTPNTAADWLLRSLRFRLATDLNAADRTVILAVTDGNTEYRRLSAGAVQAASLTRVYGGSEGVDNTAGVGTFIGLRFPKQGFWLPNGHTLNITVENVQAGDQISVIGGYRFEFPLGPRTHFWPFMAVLEEESS